MRASKIEALYDPSPACRRALRTLLRQWVEPKPQRRDVLGQFLAAGLDLGPGGVLACHYPNVAAGGPDKHGDKRFVAAEEPPHIRQRQRLGVGECGVLRE